MVPDMSHDSSTSPPPEESEKPVEQADSTRSDEHIEVDQRTHMMLPDDDSSQEFVATAERAAVAPAASIDALVDAKTLMAAHPAPPSPQSPTVSVPDVQSTPTEANLSNEGAPEGGAPEAKASGRALDDATRSLAAGEAPAVPESDSEGSAGVVSHSMDTIALREDPNALKAKILKQMEAASDAAAGPDPLMGAVIAGRFTISERIGEGGMGVVYKARQKNMDRDVAIKVLLAEMAANKTVEKRFYLEALAVSKLRHPNTIQIFDFGETENGQLYIAMEFLDGMGLKEVLRAEQQISVSRGLHIAAQILRSLREAHLKGIVHRDLKPDNVFICRVGEDPDFVKVLDFGVAKLREGNTEQATLTKTGAIFGTPRYMSPEQSVSANVDHRSDLYAIGVMLYEMLAGRPPFQADMPLSLLIMHVQDEVPMLAEVRPDLVIPGEVEDLVRKLLEKDPNERFQSAEAAIRAMETLSKELDPIYRNVVTTEHAEEIGLEISQPVMTLQNTALNPSHPQMERTLRPTDEPTTFIAPKRRGWFRWVALLLLVPLAGAGGIYFSLQRLPDAITVESQLTPVADEPLEQMKPPLGFGAEDLATVTISVKSTPPNAEIWEGTRRIGQTPFVTERLPQKGDARVWTVKKAGFEPKTVQVDPGAAYKANIVLAKVEVPVAKPTPKRPKPKRTAGKKKRPKVKTKVITKVVTVVKTKVVKVPAKPKVVAKPKKPKKPKKKKDPFATRARDLK